jgi:hypothetical protein
VRLEKEASGLFHSLTLFSDRGLFGLVRMKNLDGKKFQNEYRS